MNYIEFKAEYDPDQVSGDWLLAELTEVPFESYVEEERAIVAYIPEDDYDESWITSLELPDGVRCSVKTIKQVNWNAEWEKNFDPVTISDQCIVRAPFHTLDQEYRYDIVIQPKMSFGTGHHATTSLMLQEMLSMDFENQSVLDMGTGTGVLAILAAWRGAKHVFAVDIDSWAYENSLENVDTNPDTDAIEVAQGDVSSIEGKEYHTILANINKNIIRQDIGQYEKCLLPGGRLLISGVLFDDKEDVKQWASDLGLVFDKENQKDNWMMISFYKNVD
ncbi:50S ribosomal protein L11 methyltransferase [bacterium SCSIO 12741]|nr:50S ribosomal protein L11 methyltransferase [bacterium SCSIO 12741]